MKQNNVVQLPLFVPEPHIPIVQPAKPAEVFTFADVVRGLLAQRESGVCLGCGCSESHPCRLHDGDQCILNSRTGYCSKPDCQILAERVPLRKAVGG